MCWFLVLSVPCGAAAAARVIDGDTLEVDGRRVRIAAIDAPERRQACRDAQGRSWACGAAAGAALTAMVAAGAPVCQSRGRDRYGRTVARCTVDDADVAAELVRLGLALAHYGRNYAAEEVEAMAAGAGVWGGDFTMPWDWRAERRAAAEERKCCIRCKKGTPCGNSCIAAGKRCHQPPGCAC
jgi:endonuclease YncB( thermonuclease family)